jgi:hypothetical protein
MKRYLILISPFILSILFEIPGQMPWFSILPRYTVSTLAFSFIFLTIFPIVFVEQTRQFTEICEALLLRYRIFFFLGFLMFMFAFPFRNLAWGDGILLLETNQLETKLFGLQIAMDEIFETVLHSIVYQTELKLDPGVDNRLAFRVLSYAAGIVMLAFIGWKIKDSDKEKGSVISSLVFLSSSGFLIFFGYIENYSMVSLLIFLVIFYVRSWIIEKRSPKFLLLSSTLFVCIAIYFHLVAGYLLTLLIYIWWAHSPRLDKTRHLIVCATLGGLFLGVGFLYVLFLHDPAIDRLSTHLLHPPFYPLKRLISMNHIKEFSSVVWWNSKIAIVLILYSYLFFKNEFVSVFKKSENKALVAVLVGFSLHGFFHNPQLGFPADWDLMGFYWIPLSFMAYVLFLEIPQLKSQFLPLLIFSLTLQIFHARHLSAVNMDSEKKIEATTLIVNEYVQKNKSKIDLMPKSEKKFFAKTDFFFTKAIFITERICPFAGKSDLLTSLSKLKQEFQAATEEGKLKNKIWTRDFLTRATVTNTNYIKSLEEYKICHLAP